MQWRRLASSMLSSAYRAVSALSVTCPLFPSQECGSDSSQAGAQAVPGELALGRGSRGLALSHSPLLLQGGTVGSRTGTWEKQTGHCGPGGDVPESLLLPSV